MRKLVLSFVFAAAILVPWAEQVEAQFSPCQLCWTSSGEYGQCQDVVTPSPALNTMSNCQGIKQCFPFLGGEICRPACTGNQCFWV